MCVYLHKLSAHGLPDNPTVSSLLDHLSINCFRQPNIILPAFPLITSLRRIRSGH